MHATISYSIIQPPLPSDNNSCVTSCLVSMVSGSIGIEWSMLLVTIWVKNGGLFSSSSLKYNTRVLWVNVCVFTIQSHSAYKAIHLLHKQHNSFMLDVHCKVVDETFVWYVLQDWKYKVCDCGSAWVLLIMAPMLLGSLTCIIVYRRHHSLCIYREAMVTDKIIFCFGAEDYVTCHLLLKRVIQYGNACNWISFLLI